MKYLIMEVEKVEKVRALWVGWTLQNDVRATQVRLEEEKLFPRTVRSIDFPAVPNLHLFILLVRECD